VLCGVLLNVTWRSGRRSAWTSVGRSASVLGQRRTRQEMLQGPRWPLVGWQQHICICNSWLTDPLPTPPFTAAATAAAAATGVSASVLTAASLSRSATEPWVAAGGVAVTSGMHGTTASSHPVEGPTQTTRTAFSTPHVLRLSHGLGRMRRGHPMAHGACCEQQQQQRTHRAVPLHLCQG
jgi:hypothetical protein